jgi:hypothetical protein
MKRFYLNLRRAPEDLGLHSLKLRHEGSHLFAGSKNTRNERRAVLDLQHNRAAFGWNVKTVLAIIHYRVLGFVRDVNAAVSAISRAGTFLFFQNGDSFRVGRNGYVAFRKSLFLLSDHRLLSKYTFHKGILLLNESSTDKGVSLITGCDIRRNKNRTTHAAHCADHVMRLGVFRSQDFDNRLSVLESVGDSVAVVIRVVRVHADIILLALRGLHSKRVSGPVSL